MYHSLSFMFHQCHCDYGRGIPLESSIQFGNLSGCNTRSESNFAYSVGYCLSFSQHSFRHQVTKFWSSLPTAIRNHLYFSDFKDDLKIHSYPICNFCMSYFCKKCVFYFCIVSRISMCYRYNVCAQLWSGKDGYPDCEEFTLGLFPQLEFRVIHVLPSCKVAFFLQVHLFTPSIWNDQYFSEQSSTVVSDSSQYPISTMVLVNIV